MFNGVFYYQIPIEILVRDSGIFATIIKFTYTATSDDLQCSVVSKFISDMMESAWREFIVCAQPAKNISGCMPEAFVQSVCLASIGLANESVNVTGEFLNDVDGAVVAFTIHAYNLEIWISLLD